ncbi:hypothetical protein [Haloplanus pelagicus]|jgi:hypothetical protein|uniref:hypothetical protein n=1 Tax=Haloplanus pelagicus TaxID=2949995 RepID=UPI00203E430A|nr:hypothetical protein [Haloplanus sp. HW8-1]
MSATDASTVDLRSLPEFELECLFDDPTDPAELTIFTPDTGRLATEWITADRETARSLDRMR